MEKDSLKYKINWRGGAAEYFSNKRDVAIAVMQHFLNIAYSNPFRDKWFEYRFPGKIFRTSDYLEYNPKQLVIDTFDKIRGQHD